jgi:hypothetical protein
MRASAGSTLLREYLYDPNVGEARWLLEIAPTQLLEEATAVFELGHYQAAILLCRAACEATCFLFLTRTFTPSGVRIHPFKDRKNIDANIRFEALIDEICKRPVLAPKQCRNLRRVKKNGDTIARLAELSTTKLAYPFNYSEISLQVSRADALKDLRDTSDILRSFAKAIKTQPELMGPRGP